ncbi:MAG: hypothetical protein ABSB28_08555 [Candidatus Bathyarchaeia archaeon]
MSEKEGSKSKDKRLEEKEKQQAELERSLMVAKVKEAHKQIEDTEKLRKRSAVMSICKRINTFIGEILSTADPIIRRPEVAEDLVTEEMLKTIESFEQTYTSIIYDFQKSLDLTDEAMKKMFPMAQLRKKTTRSMIGDLINLVSQMNQIRDYCERFLI